MNSSKIGKHLISINSTVRQALIQLNDLSSDAILFVTDNNGRLVGSLTDGDLRRGFIKGLGFEDSILEFIQKNPVFIKEDEYSLDVLDNYRTKNYKVIPILNSANIVVDVLNFRTKSTIIPANAILMAGGEGKRLRP